MPYIVVDDQQAKLIAQAGEKVEVRDSQGHCLGYVTHGFTAEDIKIAIQRYESDEPRYTTKQVLDHLRSLKNK